MLRFDSQILRLSSAMGKTQNRSPSVCLSLQRSDSNQGSDHIAIFTARKRRFLGKVMFLHLCVILFTGRGVGFQQASHVTGRHPPRQTPPLGRHPPKQTPPLEADTPMADTLRQSPPRITTEAGGAHPTQMHSCVFAFVYFQVLHAFGKELTFLSN